MLDFGKTEGGVSIVYVNQYYEKNISSGQITTSYYLGSKLAAQRQGSDLNFTLNYLYQDSLNSTSLVADYLGANTGAIRYYPFGGTREVTGVIPTDRKFTGQRLDTTGLYYYNARYYDPQIGRFISADSIIADRWNSQAFKRYSFEI